jgi:hypothetical protein
MRRCPVCEEWEEMCLCVKVPAKHLHVRPHHDPGERDCPYNRDKSLACDCPTLEERLADLAPKPPPPLLNEDEVRALRYASFLMSGGADFARIPRDRCLTSSRTIDALLTRLGFEQ